MENMYYPFTNTPLPYAYNALEPYIDEKTMHLHHDKHLQTYIDRLNDTLKDHPQLQKLSLEQLIKGAARQVSPVQVSIRNNGGGVYNHRMFFEGLTNPGEKMPHGHLAAAIYRQYGTFEEFAKQFSEAAKSVFGSGYAWLVVDQGGKLRIITTPNQNTPLDLGMCPVLNLDVWEHAYYLKHYNMRADYIKDWWNIVNWKKAEENYVLCLRGKR